MDISNAARASVLVKALPYIKKYNNKIVVIKYGGNAMIDETLKGKVIKDIVLLHFIGVKLFWCTAAAQKLAILLPN